MLFVVKQRNVGPNHKTDTVNCWKKTFADTMFSKARAHIACGNNIIHFSDIQNNNYSRYLETNL